MGQSQRPLQVLREYGTFEGVDLRQDPCGSGCESRTSKELGLSQDVCESGIESGTSKGEGRNQRTLQDQA